VNRRRARHGPFLWLRPVSDLGALPYIQLSKNWVSVIKNTVAVRQKFKAVFLGSQPRRNPSPLRFDAMDARGLPFAFANRGGFWRRFDSVTGRLGPAPSPKPRQKSEPDGPSKILALNGYRISSNALNFQQTVFYLFIRGGCNRQREIGEASPSTFSSFSTFAANSTFASFPD
jgi:hypothetical protein